MLERVYCDESGQDGNNKYMLIGGLWVPHSARIELNKKFKNFKIGYNMTHEMKWTSVSKSKLEEYKKFIDIFFDSPYVRYNCIIVDCRIVDYKKYHENDKELGFYKFYYQLISRKIERNKKYKIFVDERKNRNPYRLDTLKRCCNYYAINYCSCSAFPIKDNILPVDSKKFDEIQLADVISGAIRANFENKITSTAKWDLIYYITKLLGDKLNFRDGKNKPPKDLLIKTPPYKIKFNIWYWTPKNKKAPWPLSK